MTELTRRILFALPAGALFLWLTWLGGVPFTVLMAIITLVAFFEMAGLLSKIKPGLWLWLSIPAALFFWLLPQLPDGVVLTGLALLALPTLAALLYRSSDRSRKWFSTLFCGIYVPVGLLFFLQIRSVGTGDVGFWLTLALLLMIWGNDSFAYFGGRAYGKRPLAPSISPKKTWEGFWFGFAGAATGLLFVWLIAGFLPLSPLLALPLVVIVSVLGPAGDLLESRLKRLAGVKDSSNLLPGHGGMLDRFDAFILTAPAVYLYLSWAV